MIQRQLNKSSSQKLQRRLKFSKPEVEDTGDDSEVDLGLSIAKESELKEKKAIRGKSESKGLAKSRTWKYLF